MRRIAADLTLGGGVRVARRFGRSLRFAPMLARLRLRSRRRGKGGLGRFARAALGFDLAAGGGKFAFDRLKAAAFGEAPRRACRSVRSYRETVPAPEIAFGRNEPLAGPELLGKTRG